MLELRLPRSAVLGATSALALTLAGTAAGDGPAPAARPVAARPPPRPAAPQAKRPAPGGPVAASKGWHAKPTGAEAPRDPSGRPMLVLQALNMPDHVAVPTRGERGGFAPDDLDRAAHVLREPSTGNEHPVDPRLLDLVYRIQVHFAAHEIRIISGYRTPRAGTTSNHGKGRAMDVVVPGVADEEVARFVRDQGFVGCGVYPVSGFVHVDVRERSYFWVDTSGPGKKNRTRGILGDLAARADQRALERGERPVAPFVVGRDVDALLATDTATAAAPTQMPAEDDDVDGAALPD